MYVAD